MISSKTNRRFYNLLKKLTDMCQIEVQGVKITLTKDQLDEIARQQKKQITAENITYEDAVEILKGISGHVHVDELYSTLKGHHIIMSDDEIREYKLKAIIKAVNYLDNGSKVWTPPFSDRNTPKYLPYFEQKSSGLVLHGVYGGDCGFSAPAGFYYKERKSAETIAKRFIGTLYKY